MNNGNELVSVYIPTHNRVDMLERAIMSVLKQSYPNIEIIVSDDGSQDNTKKIVTSYMQQYSNIKYVFSSEAKGACHARNLAIAKASGTYITGLDDDDEFTQDRIEE
ncbi:TPA: glycosyltransferase family 2 protein, partial [Escherichia coli]|nr:glycosyltransferase family 2 protein [Escherichia coli]